MLGPEIRCVVGIDVAKQAHVVCALEVPSGAMRHKPSRIEATAAGYALLRSWVETWAEGGPPETVLIGLGSGVWRRPERCGSPSTTP